MTNMTNVFNASDLTLQDLENMKEGSTINGNLYFEGPSVKLPNNLTINGNLEFAQYDGTSLPLGLTISEDLTITFSSITNIPFDIKAKRIFIVDHECDMHLITISKEFISEDRWSDFFKSRFD
ncbi:hypothetical protein VCRA2123O443_220052 [Vibrio crassostreae]|uniref:hypothetical protein n=1 Tax=Vibrio crassostreae TaxID=246167 RepID=UPI001B308319|nr:hypothetical protein [Vibrio crassostreae]CAK1923008.1 hypothetical protein VCRA2110O182_220003 [Vibrio crassostreae]CAK2308882.1 hypothetical protein VCRA2111O408_220003 [Vibrio crassostreae]CAK2326813.1 hypothetical protein VCRA211O406_220051 [Vibrio crassostreae]CAK3242076.1 hypothetical protein VCRA2123O443_220052 [Vibrio crassostreae]